MNRPVPPLPAQTLTLVRVGPDEALPEPWTWLERLETITLAHRGNRAVLEHLGAAADGDDPPMLDEKLAGVEQVDALDVDAPGDELGILEAAPHTLDRLFAIEVDVALNPLVPAQPLAWEVDSLLRRHGFELFQFLPRRLPRSKGADLVALAPGRPVWAESLYVRAPRQAVAAFQELRDSERERAVRRALSVCLLYGLGDYGIDLVDSTELPVSLARELRRTILLFDSHLDRPVPARFARDEPPRVLEALETWVGGRRPAAYPGRTHVSLRADQSRRLLRGARAGDEGTADRLRQALDEGLRLMRDERSRRRSAR